MGLVLLVLLPLQHALRADAQDDLTSVKRDLESLRSRIDTERHKVDDYLEESVKLRQMDKDQLAALVDQLCRADVERDDDEVDRLDKELRDKAVERVRGAYDKTVDDGSHEFDRLGDLESDAKSLSGRAHEFEDKPEVKDDAGHVREDIEKARDAIHDLMEKMNRDRSTLDRVKEGVMAGSNNPTIRARMEYGKEMHRKLQKDRDCAEKEVTLSSGRPDCIKFDPDDCKVIEFKPDTYSESAARGQAAGYISDVRERFKNDERAKHCKQDADGPIFTPVGETYSACRL
ncbi:MAG: hypothetical protein JO257_32525 [Deltaproteobacteria bacterium]|nr:hypothetical protein [Deltaproteobacteria bacterium]